MLTREHADVDTLMGVNPVVPENVPSENTWGTCCGTTSDKRLLAFIASISLSSIILIFSCVQLVNAKLDCNQEHVYVGLITLVFGVWCKSPMP